MAFNWNLWRPWHQQLNWSHPLIPNHNYTPQTQFFDWHFYPYFGQQSNCPFLPFYEGQTFQNAPKEQCRISEECTPINTEEINTVKIQAKEQNMEAFKNQDSKPKQKMRLCLRQLIEKVHLKQENRRFINKNTEANIVNQLFSFLWIQNKSRQLLVKILRNTVKVEAFYQIMKIVKVKRKGRLNRKYIKSLMSEQVWEKYHFGKNTKKGSKVAAISISEVAEAVRKLYFAFLRWKSRESILMSNRLNKELWPKHFKKCRQIRRFLFKERVNSESSDSPKIET